MPTSYSYKAVHCLSVFYKQPQIDESYYLIEQSTHFIRIDF